MKQVIFYQPSILAEGPSIIRFDYYCPMLYITQGSIDVLETSQRALHSNRWLQANTLTLRTLTLCEF